MRKIGIEQKNPKGSKLLSHGLHMPESFSQACPSDQLPSCSSVRVSMDRTSISLVSDAIRQLPFASFRHPPANNANKTTTANSRVRPAIDISVSFLNIISPYAAAREYRVKTYTIILPDLSSKNKVYPNGFQKSQSDSEYHM